MVNQKTISKILFNSLGELMIVLASLLVGLSLVHFFSSIKIYLLVIFILLFISLGVILRIFAEEILGDILSGKILKRLRFHK